MTKAYTLEQVHQSLDRIQEIYDKRYEKQLEFYNKKLKEEPDCQRIKPERELVNREPFILEGFTCISHFCEIEKGWYPSHADCCSRCVHHIVSSYGTRADRLKWNSHQDSEGALLPVSKKDVVRAKKRPRRSKSNYRRDIFKNRENNREHQKNLLRLKASGVSVLRRTKDDTYKNLVLFSVRDKEILPQIGKAPKSALHCAAVIKGMKGNPFVTCLDTVADVVEHINDAIKFQNNRFSNLDKVNEITENDLFSGAVKLHWILRR